MQKKTRVTVVGLICIVLLLAALPLFQACSKGGAEATATKTTNIKILGGDVGVGTYLLGAAYATIVNRYLPDMKATMIPAGGFNFHMQQMQKGEAEVGMNMGWAIKSTMTGKGYPWEGQTPYTALRTLFTPTAAPATLFTRADKNIKDIYSLKGKRIAIQTERYMSRQSMVGIWKAAGYDLSKDLTVKELDDTGIASAYANDQVDAFIRFSAAGAAATVETAQTTPTNFLDIPKEVMDKLNAPDQFGEGAFTPFTIPKGTYKGMAKDVATVQQTNVYMVDQKMSEETAYKLTKVIFDNMAEAIKIWGDWKYATKDMATSPTYAPFHPGAVKYFKEKGWMK